MDNNSRLWFTWEHQPRNISMSRELGAQLVQLESSRSRLMRYFELSKKTLHTLRASKPSIVFAQNPSIVLSLLIVLLKRIFGYVCVIDEHNAGLFPAEGESRILNKVALFIMRNADFVIVTNQALKEYCEEKGGSACICPDPLPDMGATTASGKSGEHLEGLFQVMLVCSWAEDEPYEEVIKAAKILFESGEKIEFLVTGNPKSKLDNWDLPENFRLTGYLENDDYKSTMSNVDAVMVLTKRDNCMNCGAYEAVSSLRPGVLSNKEILKSYFSKGFVFTSNEAGDIADSVLSLKEDYAKKVLDINEMKQALVKMDHKHISLLNEEISKRV